MTKYSFMFFSFMFMTFITYMIDLITIADETGVYTTTFNNPDLTGTLDTVSVVNVASLMRTYWAIITLNISGIPIIIISLLFWSISSVFIYLVAEIIKDLIPFT